MQPVAPSTELALAGPDGMLRFPAIWLRDNCPCGACKDPQTGQKLFGVTDIPQAVAVASSEESPDSVLDLKKREAISKQVQEFARTDVPIIFLVALPVTTAFRKAKVTGYVPNPSDYYFVTTDMSVS